MAHLHQWQCEPPEGKLQWSKSWDERYRDEEDMAANAMFQSPEEIQRLRLSLEKDPKFETSSNWPSLVEWCSTCTSTRLVRLELPEEKKEVLEPVADKEEEIVAVCKVEEEDSSCEATAKDACTQTARMRRRGGRGSRMRRLLAFQLMLNEMKGLPLSLDSFPSRRPTPGSPRGRSRRGYRRSLLPRSCMGRGSKWRRRRRRVVLGRKFYQAVQHILR